MTNPDTAESKSRSAPGGCTFVRAPAISWTRNRAESARREIDMTSSTCAFGARSRPARAMAIVMCALGIGLVSRLGAQKEVPRPRTTMVELDAVVVDSHERPIRGLRQEDFQIKEDGHAVTLTSFKEISAAGIDGRQDGRSLVLLLDDTGVGPRGTLVVQNIARLFLSRTRPTDAVAVVRLTHHDDEAVGDI